MKNKYLSLLIIILGFVGGFLWKMTANQSILFIAVVLVAVYFFWIASTDPKRLKGELRESSAWNNRRIKRSIIWAPFLLIAIFLQQQFWKNSNEMIIILGLISLFVSLIIYYLMFYKRPFSKKK